MKEQAREDIKKESQRLEKASGSKDSQNYQHDPEATQGKRGRPSKSKHEKRMEKKNKWNNDKWKKKNQTYIPQKPQHCKINI